MRRARFIALAWLGGALFFSSPSLAARPFLASESATPIERDSSRLEVGYQFSSISKDDYLQRFLFELTFGLLNNLDFEVEIPVQVAKRGDDEQSGLGDLRLKSKIRFLKGREANPLSLAGQLSIKFPTCDEDLSPTSQKKPIPFLDTDCTGEPDVGLFAIASKTFYPATVHLNVGYIFTGDPPSLNPNDVFSYDLAFDVETPLERLNVVAELAGEVNRDVPYSGQDPLAVLLGGVYRLTPRFHLDLALGIGLSEGSPDHSATTGLAFFF